MTIALSILGGFLLGVLAVYLFVRAAFHFGW